MRRGLLVKVGVGAAVVLSAASLVVATVALLEARDAGDSSADDSAHLLGLEPFMTRREVVMHLGLPDRVFRRNPRAECWAYGGPYEVRMCFGPKRRLAWTSSNVPDERLLEELGMRPPRTTEN